MLHYKLIHGLTLCCWSCWGWYRSIQSIFFWRRYDYSQPPKVGADERINTGWETIQKFCLHIFCMYCLVY